MYVRIVPESLSNERIILNSNEKINKAKTILASLGWGFLLSGLIIKYIDGYVDFYVQNLFAISIVLFLIYLLLFFLKD